MRPSWKPLYRRGGGRLRLAREAAAYDAGSSGNTMPVTRAMIATLFQKRSVTIRYIRMSSGQCSSIILRVYRENQIIATMNAKVNFGSRIIMINYT